MSRRRLVALTSLFCLAGMTSAFAEEKFVPNYEESKVPEFELPDPLRTAGGEIVSEPSSWNQTRRPELLELFRQHVYGRSPEPCSIQAELVSSDDQAVHGKALRREIDVRLGDGDKAPVMRMLVYTPKADHPVAAFLGLNFQGNHTIDPDPEIRVAESWVRDRRDETTAGNHATAAGRGVAASRWPVETILDRGYGLVTIYYGDIDPDVDDGFENGIHGQFKSWAETISAGERWGSIAGWAYGLSRALDYLESDPHIDGGRVAVFGHSRLGKTSLWAGASDPRFQLVISNDSGCGGAALSRRAFGETVGRINRSFPHWFCDNFKQYNEHESALPVDQHELIALIAPRPVYVASASEDQWADPKGEFLAARHAGPVYEIFALDGLLKKNDLGRWAPPDSMPPVNQPLNAGTIGYHIRTGKHDVTDFDWAQYLDFADRHL